MRNGHRILGIVLAGGAGKRLSPLTADRAKPAVPFGGAYRLIDFVLSNLVNARIRRIAFSPSTSRIPGPAHLAELAAVRLAR